MDTSKLIDEALQLYNRLIDAFENEFLISPSSRTGRIHDLSVRALKRRIRRIEKKNNPVGFAPSPAQPSGVLGQGTHSDGKYYEIECSECDAESCVNCGLIQSFS